MVRGGATLNNGAEIPLGYTIAGDSWLCEVYASDGIDTSAPINPVLYYRIAHALFHATIAYHCQMERWLV